MNKLFKALMIGMSVIGLAFTGVTAIAADTEAPATEHQEEALKGEQESDKAREGSEKAE